MILSHMAPSCLNMSPYRTIWTHFTSNSMIFVQTMPPGPGSGSGRGPGSGPGPGPGPDQDLVLELIFGTPWLPLGGMYASWYHI